MCDLGVDMLRNVLTAKSAQQLKSCSLCALGHSAAQLCTKIEASGEPPPWHPHRGSVVAMARGMHFKHKGFSDSSAAEPAFCSSVRILLCAMRADSCGV